MLDRALPAFRGVGDVRCVGRAALELVALALDAQRPDGCVDLLDECERASQRVDDRVTLTRAQHLRDVVHATTAGRGDG